MPQLPSTHEYRISLIVTQFQCKNAQARGFTGNALSDLEALCIRLESDSDLQPIRIKEPDNWWSPFVATSIILIAAAGGATNMHMCAISVVLLLLTGLWRGIECGCVVGEKKGGGGGDDDDGDGGGGGGGCRYLIWVEFFCFFFALEM